VNGGMHQLKHVVKRFFVLTFTAVALVGCSASKLPSSNSTTSTVSAATLPPGVTGVTALPANIPNDPKLRANVRVGSCKAAFGSWVANGTVINPTVKTVTYTITIFFTTATATVLAVGQTHVAVPAGGRQSWTISQKFHGSEGTLCVLRGVG
jgi:hypothetical protein